jgi:hypothetical protein
LANAVLTRAGRLAGGLRARVMVKEDDVEVADEML